MPKYLRNRVYSLIVGTEEDAIEISNLQIKFTVTKTSNNREKKNQARVEIYNLSEERRKALEDRYVTVQLKVGYADALDQGEELISLFSGQVVDLQVQDGDEGSYRSKRSNTDIITTLTVDEYFKEMNGRIISKTVPAGKTVKDVVLGVVEDMPEITRYEIAGKGVETEVADGFPMSGTPRQILDKLTRAYNIEWQVDQSVLYVSDIDGSFSKSTEGVPLIGQFSGMIESPQFKSEDPKRLRLKDEKPGSKGKSSSKNTKQKKQTLHLKILLNPAITAGSIIKVEYGDIDSYFKVDEVTHTGSYEDRDWYSKLICSALPQ